MKIEAIVWLAVSVVILYLVWKTLSPVLSPIIIAATLVYILYPLHRRLSTRIGTRASAFILTAVVTLMTFLFIIGFAVWMSDVKQSLVYYLNAVFNWLISLNLPPALSELINKLSESISQRFEGYILGYTYSLPKLSLQALVMIFVFYGILVNARPIRDEIYSLLPSENRELAVKLMEKTEKTLNDLLRSWLTISVLKGVAVTLGFFALHIVTIGEAIALGIFTVLLELLPVVGGWITWLGGVVYLLNSGGIVKALLLTLYGLVFVSPVPDIVLRPKVSMRERGISAMISFIGILGGLMAFGIVGIIIGPVVLGLMATLLEEWKETRRGARAGSRV